MIEIKEKTIHHIPVLEVASNKLDVENSPLMILYHGWKNSKESMMNWAVAAASQGFLVIVPDAFNHGNRHQQRFTNDGFWHVIFRNIEECEHIVNWYVDHAHIDPNKVVVGGQSMGGITVNALMVRYDWLAGAMSLMGSPDFLGFTLYLMDISNEKLTQASDIFNVLENLDSISLHHHFEQIAGRPFYLWHDEQDQIIPFYYAQTFYSQFKGDPALLRTKAEWTNSSGHHVPFPIIKNATNFMKKELNDEKL